MVPSVKLKFFKDTLKEAGFRKWNEFKVAMPCRAGKRYDQLVLKEYLVYRLYTLLTDRSFRVKLVDLHIVDSGTGQDYGIRPGFFLEDDEELAGRLRLKALDTMNVGAADLLSGDYTRLQVFEFMIGNTDWIPLTGHNIALFRMKDGGGVLPVPYDFDFSGLVSADYARPNELTKLLNVQQRFFMGNDKTLDDLEGTFDLFREKKTAMLSLIENFEELEQSERKRIARYVESFFQIIDNPRLARQHFVDKPPFQQGIY